MSNERPKKLQRISQACDLCHRRSIRCRPSAENAQEQCQNCYDFAVPCTYRRPSRRRRSQFTAGTTSTVPDRFAFQQPPSPVIASGSAEGVKSRNPSDAGRTATDFPRSTVGYEPAPSAGGWDDPVDVAWRSFAAASTHVIHVYLDTYMNVVHPFLPLFHGPTLWGQIRHRYHLANRGFFASVMAACALAAARAKDGAATQAPHRSSEPDPGELAAVFVHAARDAIFADHDRGVGVGVEYLRASALLAATSMQLGQMQDMHRYLGHYTTLSAMQQFHDESTWPATLSIVEREGRRRLFWSVYHLDIYASAVFDGVPRFQELYTSVAYPSSESYDGWVEGGSQDEDEKIWLRGWNFITDLYRVLEHAMKRLQWHRRGIDDKVVIGRFFGPDTIPDSQVMDHILNLYRELPDRVKDFSAPLTSNQQQNMFSLQAINIQATLQLVRITLLESNGSGDDHAKCEVVEQILWAFESMTFSALRAFGTPLVYHLGAIGRMLAAAMRGVVAEDALLRARKSLESLAGFLNRLESGLQSQCSASERLRTQMMILDQHIQAQRQTSPLARLTEADSLAARRDFNMMEVPVEPVPAVSHPPEAQDTLTPSEDLHSISGDWSWPFDLTQETMANGSPLTSYAGSS